MEAGSHIEVDSPMASVPERGFQQSRSPLDNSHARRFRNIDEDVGVRNARLP